ncbi:MAG TPA: hypothetical protein VNJ07_09485 [Chitinophagales bacterium]|nr:hypothetical protein [Chitinophagales bacterium]
MKQSILIWLCLVIFFAGCKKDPEEGDNNNNTGNNSFTPAYIAPTEPGILQVSASQIIIHQSESVTVTCKLFNSDGSLAVNQPVFQWSSNQIEAATVNAGVIVAQGIGNALISVTDGSHGFAYVNVNVVADSINIPAGAANITFDPPVITLLKNQSANFDYTLSDLSGNTIAGTPDFQVSPSGSGISFSGSIMNAGNQTGSFKVDASVNGDSLNGSLFLDVLDTGYNYVLDTNWRVTRIELVNYPKIFWKYDKVAIPLRISIFESRMTQSWQILRKVYQTSPDAIIIDHPEVISVNGDGQLISQVPGSTKITVTYQELSWWWNAFVAFDFTGNWGGERDGHQFNFCLTTKPDEINYGRGGTSWFSFLEQFAQQNWLTCDLLIDTCKRTNLQNYSDYFDIIENTGQLEQGANITEFSFQYPNNCINYPGGASGNVLYGDKDHMRLIWGSSLTDYVLLTRGTGDCSSSVLTLEQALVGGGGKRWYPNACIRNDIIDVSWFQFNSDHTLIAFDGTDIYNSTWVIADSLGQNNWIFFDDELDGLGNHVSYYDSDSIIIDSYLDVGPPVITIPCTGIWTSQ